jgi:hypothetical protein
MNKPCLACENQTSQRCIECGDAYCAQCRDAGRAHNGTTVCPMCVRVRQAKYEQSLAKRIAWWQYVEEPVKRQFVQAPVRLPAPTGYHANHATITMPTEKIIVNR